MQKSIRSLLAATVFTATVFTAAPAMAQEEESDISLSANVAIVSEYRFRGVDLSGGDIAIQGGVDVGLPAGFYVGTWASSTDEDTVVGYGHTELDVYGGWTGELGDTVTLDVGVIGYLYPNSDAGNFDYFEGYASVAADLGPASVTVGAAYAPDQDSLGSRDNLYLYTDVGVGIGDSPLSLSGHLGYTDGFLTYTTDGNAFDWSVGANIAVGENISLGVSYVGAEGDIVAPNYDFVDDAVVASLSASF